MAAVRRFASDSSYLECEKKSLDREVTPGHVFICHTSEGWKARGRRAKLSQDKGSVIDENGYMCGDNNTEIRA